MAISAHVKYAGELVTGDWINVDGTAAEVINVQVFKGLSDRVYIALDTYPATLTLGNTELVEYVTAEEWEAGND